VGSANPGGDELLAPIGDVQNQDLGDGATLTKQGNTVTVTTPEYTMTFNTQQQAAGKQFINMQVQTGTNGVAQDQSAPTGVLGETFDADSYSRSYVGSGMDGADPYQQTTLPGKVFTWDPNNNGQAGYVQSLYGNLLGQAPTDDEVQQVSQLINQQGLPAGIKQMMQSDAFSAKQYSNPQKAAVLYQAIFQKTPDPSAVSHYVDELNNGQSPDAVVDEMTHTPDYFAEYNSGQAPSSMSNKEAIQTLYDHYSDIRDLKTDGNDWWHIGRYMHRRNLEAVLNNDQFDAQTQAAAKQVLDNTNLLNKLDAANDSDGDVDDKIAGGDFDAILNDPQINSY
jgi:hypothetical protein